MKRSDLQVVLNNESCPKWLQHILLYQNDRITEFERTFDECKSAIQQLASLIEMTSNMMGGFSQDVDAVKRRMGVTVESVPVPAEHKENMPGGV